MAPSCVIEVKKGDIIATFTDESGQKVREDRVALGNLDTIVRYDAKEKIIYISAIKGCEECVTRKLMVQKVKKGYSRMSFVLAGDESEKEIKGIRKAFRHLIRIGSEFRYHDEIVFE